MFFNLFPRIVVFEVNLTPPQIMQAIHDNMMKKNSTLDLLLGKNNNKLDGNTAGLKFDIRRVPQSSRDYIWLHGELEMKDENKTTIEISSYPLVAIGLPIVFLLVGFSIGIINVMLNNSNPSIEKFYAFIFLLGIYIVDLSIYFALFIFDFNKSVRVLKQILNKADIKKSR
jgi:hypothetical protein